MGKTIQSFDMFFRLIDYSLQYQFINATTHQLYRQAERIGYPSGGHCNDLTLYFTSSNYEV